MTREITREEYLRMTNSDMAMTIYETEKYELCYYPDETTKIIVVDCTEVEYKYFLLSNEDSKLIMAECLLYKMDEGICVPDIYEDEEEEAIETLLYDIIKEIK